MKRFWISAILWTAIVLIANATGTSKSVTDSTSAQPTYNRYGYSEPQRFESSWTQAIPHFGPLMYVAVLLLIYVFSGVNIIYQWNRRGVMRLGRYIGNIGPGLRWMDPIFHWIVEEVSLQDEVWDLELKSVQTKDNVPISLKLVLTTRVENVDKYIVKVDGATSAVESRALAAATQLVGENDLDILLHNREQLHEKLETLIEEKIDSWGVIVIASEISDPKITDPAIENAISLKARAQKEGEAELARAQMQKQIVLALNEAAGTLTDAGRWLKDREVLLEMSRSAENNTILIPTGLVDLMRTIAPATASKLAPTSL